jgi:hypothetical protein
MVGQYAITISLYLKHRGMFNGFINGGVDSATDIELLRSKTGGTTQQIITTNPSIKDNHR